MSLLANTILAAVSDPAATNPGPVASAASAPAVDLDAIRAEAAAAERTRIMSIDALAVAGCETLIADAKSNGWTPGDTATAVVAKIKADGMLDAVAALSSAAATVPAIAADTTEAGTAAPVAGAPEGPETWAKSWHASEKLQEEFPTAEAYVAVKRRETLAG
ncbi:hypothetical protein [Pleomorphomonas sp. JP5]|uniref:hypothetical protein n=1 Tax=Pleomorphomonas sp. JP5 TaxID=2942998 RepID=UPI002044AB57|nr:hypothetical protein [Pleomorphomonas sp. JP5]MCM5560309.1 hypothetical protein [Pleomorphomonas sp. JP5]